MSIKTELLTFAQAIEHFYGGVHGLAKSALPFKCECGMTTYPQMWIDELGIKREAFMPVMNLDDCFKHVRRNHRKRLKM
jgi:hypothetical protein